MSDKTTPNEPFDVTVAREARIAEANRAVKAESGRHTRRSFALGALAAAAGVGFYEYLYHGPETALQPNPLEDAYKVNAAISRRVFREHALAPTYPLDRAETLRINGNFGLKREMLPDTYRLQLVGMQGAAQHRRFVPDVNAWTYKYTPDADADKEDAEEAAAEGDKSGRRPKGEEFAGQSDSNLDNPTPGLLLTLADITALPRVELVTQFKCIEGWSQIVHWGGVRMADFLEQYPPAPIDGKEPQYVYMETPDGDYYTGYDMITMRHPQTLLVTEMMGRPLEQFHGAPLRLHMPTKYGYKQIKRIGLVEYTNDKPDDFWSKVGYDWYAGL